MLHTEVHIVEVAIQPTSCPEFDDRIGDRNAVDNRVPDRFPLTYSQGTVYKHKKLVAKFQLRQTEYDLFW